MTSADRIRARFQAARGVNGIGGYWLCRRFPDRGGSGVECRQRVAQAKLIQHAIFGWRETLTAFVDSASERNCDVATT